MTDRTQLGKSVSAHEGFRALPYLDTQKRWTIGIGRCLETHPLSAEEWKYLLSQKLIVVSIAKGGADWLMWRELDACVKECEQFEFWPRLNNARRNVLVEMAYQMGIQKLKDFRNMLGALAAGNWSEAESHGLDSLWAKQTPDRARELMTQLRTGEFDGID